MIRKTIFAAIAGIMMLLAAPQAQAQKYFTRDAKVSFDATAANSPENIQAVSKSGALVLDKSAGAVQMSVLLKGLTFEKALMQEHFNENYLETSKFPKAEFKGTIDNLASVNFSKDGTYTTKVSGNMTMHGVTKPLTAPVTFIVKGGQISSTANFKVTLADYDVSVPSLVSDKVNKEANISVTASLAVLNK